MNTRAKGTIGLGGVTIVLQRKIQARVVVDSTRGHVGVSGGANSEAGKRLI